MKFTRKLLVMLLLSLAILAHGCGRNPDLPGLYRMDIGLESHTIELRPDGTFSWYRTTDWTPPAKMAETGTWTWDGVSTEIKLTSKTGPITSQLTLREGRFAPPPVLLIDRRDWGYVLKDPNVWEDPGSPPPSNLRLYLPITDGDGRGVMTRDARWQRESQELREGRRSR
jgi:hypothetical protein